MNPSTYTDQQLQLALAKMLPNELIIDGPCKGWTFINWSHNDKPVRETEWLHVCWLIEQTLKHNPLVSLDNQYASLLYETADENQQYIHELTWQQRALALAKVKGVEIV